MFAVQAAHQLNLWWGGLPDVAHRIKEAVQWTLRERPLS
jgi:shikimate 5-dehydrogenase